MIITVQLRLEIGLNYYGVNLYCVKNKIICTKCQQQFSVPLIALFSRVNLVIRLESP